MRYTCPDTDACVRHHHAMAKAVMRALDCTNATWLPVFGTLLGLMRNQVRMARIGSPSREDMHGAGTVDASTSPTTDAR